MANLRWGKRFHADLKARFGIEDYSSTGLIDDLSVFGFFLRSGKFFHPATLLKIQILTQEGQAITLEGTVQWNQKRQMCLIWVTKDAGMGIKIQRFLTGQDHYDDLCRKLCQIDTVKKNESRETGHAKKKTGEFFKRFLRR